jgi:hypothetical protein
VIAAARSRNPSFVDRSVAEFLCAELEALDLDKRRFHSFSRSVDFHKSPELAKTAGSMVATGGGRADKPFSSLIQVILMSPIRAAL